MRSCVVVVPLLLHVAPVAEQLVPCPPLLLLANQAASQQRSRGSLPPRQRCSCAVCLDGLGEVPTCPPTCGHSAAVVWPLHHATHVAEVHMLPYVRLEWTVRSQRIRQYHRVHKFGRVDQRMPINRHTQNPNQNERKHEQRAPPRQQHQSLSLIHI